MRAAVLRLGVLLLPLVLVACGGAAKSPTSGASNLFSPGVVPTSDQLCQLLTPDDWKQVGLTNARAPSVDDDGPGTGSAYCIYYGGTGATTDLELDVFVGATVDDATINFATLAQSLPPSDKPSLSGIDDGLINTNIDPGFGAILVRAGKVVLDISLPTSSSAGSQLTNLAQTVLGRALSLE